MAKAILVSDGGFYFMRNVSIPVTVDCTIDGRYAIKVTKRELARVGGDADYLDESPRDAFTFFIGDECIIVE